MKKYKYISVKLIFVFLKNSKLLNLMFKLNMIQLTLLILRTQKSNNMLNKSPNINILIK